MPSSLPPLAASYHPGMGLIARRAINAFRSHWKSHGNAYPQKLILTAEQTDDLFHGRCIGRMGFPEAGPPEGLMFFGRPIEVSNTTPGEIVACDGKATSLAEFDEVR